jgi:hypothetical protein
MEAAVATATIEAAVVAVAALLVVVTVALRRRRRLSTAARDESRETWIARLVVARLLLLITLVVLLRLVLMLGPRLLRRLLHRLLHLLRRCAGVGLPLRVRAAHVVAVILEIVARFHVRPLIGLLRLVRIVLLLGRKLGLRRK